MQPESPPPSKQCHINHVQAGQESFIIRLGRQEQSCTDNNPPPSNPVQMPACCLVIIPNFPLPSYIYPCLSPSPPHLCLTHHQHWICFNHQGMHIVKHLVSSLTMFFWIFKLRHIKLAIKAMMRILKKLLKGMQPRLPTLTTMELMTFGIKRMLPWKVMWIHMRASFQIWIS